MGQLEEELEAGHLVIFLKLKQDEERLILHVAVRCRDELVLQLIDGALDDLNRLASFLEKLDHADKCRAHVVITLAQQRLLYEPIQTLHVLLVDDLCEDTKCVCLDHVILRLLDVLAQARDDNENFVLVHLKLLDEDIDQATKVLMLGWLHLEELCHVEKHRALLQVRKVLALYPNNSWLANARFWRI